MVSKRCHSINLFGIAQYEAYNANPLAFAIVEITTSFVMGKGVKVAAKNKKLQGILNGFWSDPDNRMESRVYDMCRELSMYGEIFVRFFVNQFDGTVKVRMIDPSIIDQVETDPDDIETQLRCQQRPIGPSPTQNVDSINIINPNVINGQNPGHRGITGKWFEAGTEVVHFAVNKVSNAKRGKSDLATLLPWLRRYKDWLTDRVRKDEFWSVGGPFGNKEDAALAMGVPWMRTVDEIAQAIPPAYTEWIGGN